MYGIGINSIHFNFDRFILIDSHIHAKTFFQMMSIMKDCARTAIQNLRTLSKNGAPLEAKRLVKHEKKTFFLSDTDFLVIVNLVKN